MLWKLFSSDEKVMRALEQSGNGYDISPDTLHMPANNDAPAPPAASGQKTSRLWLEGWCEKDEARLKRKDHHWEGYTT